MLETNRFEIKEARYEDMPAIASIIRSSAEWYKPLVHEDDLKEHEVGAEWIDKNFKRRDFYLGKNSDGENVGTISMQFFGKQTYLGYIYLNTKHVGKGHGKKLMNFAKEKSLEMGQESMILIAHPQASWAIKAYQKFGFERKHTKKTEILTYKSGALKPYYEEGFHLFEYQL